MDFWCFLAIFELMSDSLTAHTGWAKSMPFASINPTNPRTNPWKFHEKILRIGGAGKWGFFEAAILNFLSRPFWIFFCFISVKNPALLYEVSFFSALWMVSSEFWKRLHSNSFAHDCKHIFCFHESVFEWHKKLISHRSQFWQLGRKPASYFQNGYFFKILWWFH